MNQNIYDENGFFSEYSKLPRSVMGLAGAPEWPALRAMVSDVTNLHIADLGCGFGWFCRWAAENGAASVTGYDLSDKMLDRARSETPDERIVYTRADLETMTLPSARFDLVYSSLAFHYVKDLDRLFDEIHRSLVAGGRFVFSMEHPIFMASQLADWIIKSDGSKSWPVDSYQVEGTRTTNWLAEGVIKYHRKLATTLNLLIKNNFTIRHVDEWGPDLTLLADRPEFADERERPMFVLIAAES